MKARGTPAKPEMHKGLPVLGFANQQAFADWVATRPADTSGAWVKLAKKGAQGLNKAEAVDVALCHGWIDGQLDKYDATHWLVRFTPRKPRSKWSEINRKRAQQLIALKRMCPAGFAQIDAAKADGRWEAAYAPASKAKAPSDLQDALDRSPKAARFFATLSSANRYAILYRIAAVKKAETRARKIAEFVAMLKRGETIHG